MDGEASLAAGDTEKAAGAFERVGNMVHEAHSELGILRTQMQAGEYRQALAFAAHTAGVHLDDAAGAALYAWLLNLGAQVVVAEQTLHQVELRAPNDEVVRLVRQRMDKGVLTADGLLLNPPARMAPYVTGDEVSADAQVVGSALLLSDGAHAVAPLSALPRASSAGMTVWVRNGLGRTVSATLEQRDEALDVALLKLSAILPVAGGGVVAPRDAFPGSPALVLDYPVDQSNRPAWPLMRAGFLGMPVGAADPLRKLGIDLPGQGWRGGPVYDQGGRLVGVALRHGASDRLLPIGLLRQRFGERFGEPASQTRSAPVGVDEVYEHAMRSSLQVLLGQTASVD